MRVQSVQCETYSQAKEKCPWSEYAVRQHALYIMFESEIDYTRWSKANADIDRTVENTHCLSYAYPTSAVAVAHSCGVTGCYVLEFGLAQTAFKEFGEAIAAMKLLGSLPERWSIEHSLNIRFMSVKLFNEYIQSMLQSVIKPKPRLNHFVFIAQSIDGMWRAWLNNEKGGIIKNLESVSRILSISQTTNRNKIDSEAYLYAVENNHWYQGDLGREFQ